MPLEDTLRDELQRQAADLSLPDREPGRAVARAQARRRNRRVAVGATAAAALLAVAVVPQLGGDSDGGDPVTAGVADGAGLPLTGPLAFDWQATQDGLSSVRSSFQADDGTIYALATGPGVRYQDYPDGDFPVALYRLGSNGAWEAVPLDGDRPRAVDATTGGGLLYAISTGPDGGDGYNPQLSTSADGGETWTTEDIAAAAPPSEVVPWLKSSSMTIESDGATTLAVVSTSFRPNQEEVFPQLKEPGAYARYQAVPQADGFALVETAVAGVDPAATAEQLAEAAASGEFQNAAPPTIAPAPSGATTTVPSRREGVEAEVIPPGAPGAVTGPGGTVVELRSWADLGVSGLEALGAKHEVFRNTGDGWAPVEWTGLPADFNHADLTVAGGKFVVSGYATLDGSTTAYTSADGATWAPVTAPLGQVVGVGSALLSLPFEGTVAHVSPDGGASWTEVDLAAAGVRPDSYILDVDSGPLGVAFVATDANNTESQLVVSGDLVDWTATPLAEVTGTPGVTGSGVVVGADRIVVSASTPRTDPTAPLGSVTAVGTPVRQD